MIHLVKGSDPELVARALHDLVVDLLAGDDRALAVEEVTVPGRASSADAEGDGDPDAVQAILVAAQSPPFMTSRRIVVVRDYEHLSAADADLLAPVLDDPLDTTELVFVTSGSGRVPKRLAEALRDARVVGGGKEDPSEILARALDAAGLRLDANAAKAVLAHAGRDAGTIPGVVDVLGATFGAGARLSLDDVRPYLVDEGVVPPWELTNRIEAGDAAGALAVLTRLLSATSPSQPKPMHALQVLGVLHSRYRRLALLDTPEITSVEQAHAVLGGRGSTFPSRKALEASRALGSDGLRRAFEHLHRSDLALKGASAMPEGAPLEVAVVRLAALSRRRGRRPS